MPKTELGEHLKQRFIEFDIHGSAEQLMPCFDEALAALRYHGDDPHAFSWGCRALHEILRLPIDAFRQRIGEVAAIEPVRDRVVHGQSYTQLTDIRLYPESNLRANYIFGFELFCMPKYSSFDLASRPHSVDNHTT